MQIAFPILTFIAALIWADLVFASEFSVSITKAVVTANGQLDIDAELVASPGSESSECVSLEIIGVGIYESGTNVGLFMNPPEEPGLSGDSVPGYSPSGEHYGLQIGDRLAISRVLEPWPGAYRETPDREFAGRYVRGTPIQVSVTVYSFACDQSWNEAVEAKALVGHRAELVEVSGDVRAFIAR